VNSVVEEYRAKRKDFFARHAALWPGTLRDPFDVLGPYELQQSDIRELMQAVAAVAKLYKRIVPLLRSLPDDGLMQMGVPVSLLNIVRCQIPRIEVTLVGRLDFVRTTRGYKLLEFNTEAPGLVVETFALNGKICQEARKSNPNQRAEVILARAVLDGIRAGLEYLGKLNARDANVVFTFSRNCSNDRATAEYLARLVRGISVVDAQSGPSEDLMIDKQGLYDSNGRTIDVLYRVLSLQFLHSYRYRCRNLTGPVRTGADPESGDLLCDLIERRRFAVLNPPSAFLLESKAVQVIIWKLYEESVYFDGDERQMIESYILPTYMDPLTDNEPYVRKPVYGAEGDSIAIMNSDGKPITRSDCTTYSDQPMVYQKYAELPTIQVMTEHGPRLLHVTTSCFFLSGKPVGICMRAGGIITDDSAWVLAVCVGE